MGKVYILIAIGEDGRYATGQDKLVEVTLESDATRDQLLGIAAGTAAWFSEGLTAAASDNIKHERRARGEASIAALFEGIRKGIADEAKADEPERPEFDPGPEVDDQGGMSEAPRFTEELERVDFPVESEAPDGIPAI